MQLKLKRIAPFQAGKMLAACYGLMSLLFIPFMLFFMTMGSFAVRHQGSSPAPALPLMFGMGIGFMVLVPFLYTAMGFVIGVIGAAIYNLLAGWLGGFELEFEPKQPPMGP